MTFSMKRVSAILHKDYKDVSRNMYVATTVFLPLILAAFYGRMGVEDVQSHYMIINLTFVLVATYVQSSLIAEEKEKNTLRGLMLSPASTLEIFCGKSLLSLITTIIIMLLSVSLMDYNPSNSLLIIIAMFLSAIFYLGLGTMIGLLTKSVMEASVAVMPAMAIFTFGSMVTPFVEKYPILAIAEYMPNLQLIDLANQVEAGASLAEVGSNLVIIVLWSIAIYALCMYLYKKSMVDE
ncbi:ABC-2 family transporter protein [compost metagenome]